MHEASLVRELRRQVEELLHEHGACRATMVKVRVGEFSGVEPDLLESAFEEQSRNTSLQGAKLVVSRASLTGACRSCQASFRIERFRFVCPECCSGDVLVTGGEELLLESVTMEAGECPHRSTN